MKTQSTRWWFRTGNGIRNWAFPALVVVLAAATFWLGGLGGRAN
ncbi:MAG: hypothetical protein ABJD11_09225 [Gemmatimonadota bacterium]